jgi:N-acetylglucosamine kinase-like BadF-type ATPase
VGLVIGADGGSSKTELVVATVDGELVACLRGPGSNAHAVGAEGTARVLGELVERAALDEQPEHGVFYLCGADLPTDLAALGEAVRRRSLVRHAVVDNDTFALLRAGSDGGDAVAVACGSGINCVGRAADGRVARYPGLGWESGDWGGGGDLGREALFRAVRAEDGREEPTELVALVCRHFDAGRAVEVGEAIHYRRLEPGRLAELAPGAIELARAGDAGALALVDRLAEEVALLVRKALRDLGLAEADVVLGGGLLRGGFLVELVAERLPEGTRPVVVSDPPVLGSALAALDAAGASPEAKQRLREALRAQTHEST